MNDKFSILFAEDRHKIQFKFRVLKDSMSEHSAMPKSRPANFWIRFIRVIFTTLFLCHLILLTAGVESVDARSVKPTRHCGKKAEKFLQWLCNDRNFRFTFPFRTHGELFFCIFLFLFSKILSL